MYTTPRILQTLLASLFGLFLGLITALLLTAITGWLLNLLFDTHQGLFLEALLWILSLLLAPTSAILAGRSHWRYTAPANPPHPHRPQGFDVLPKK